MDEEAEAPRRGWRAFVGPVILSTWKRRYYRGLLVVWLILAVAAVVTDRFALLWIPLVGTAGTGLLLLRDRAGRQG